MSEEFKMPHSGHTQKELAAVIKMLKESQGLYIELLDAFLAEYKRSGNIYEAVGFACYEWDL